MKRLTFFMSALLTCLNCLSEPIVPLTRRTIQLQDGTTIEVKIVGDENGWYYYDDKTNTYYIKEQGSDNYVSTDVVTVNHPRVRKRSSTKNIDNRPFGFCSFQGKHKGLMILVEFTDSHFDSSHNTAFYSRILNDRNLQDEKLAGSVKDYFLEQSNGKFELEFDVVGPITMDNPTSYYGVNTDHSGNVKMDANLGELVVTACKSIDASIDFSKYDWNGDGEVEQIGIIYAGTSESFYPEEHPEYIWSQKSYLGYYESQEALNIDGVIVDDFFCAPELRAAGKENGIGTICHEFSHCLGLPDMYDYNNPSAGTGHWDLMCYGGHNKEGFVPAGYTAFEKMYCGWQQPIELTDDTHISEMKALSIGGNAYMISNKAYPNEFYMLENRQDYGFDYGLPGHGLLITYVDYNSYQFASNSVNANSKEEVEKYTVIVADGKEDKNRQGCCYPTIDNNCFTNTSTPAATLHHKNIDGSYLLGKPIQNIEYNSGDKTVSFTFSNHIGDQYYKKESEIHVEEAGTLSSLISEENKYGIESLKISGKINGTDLRLLRQMCGRDENGEPTAGSLKVLDLQDARIVAGGEPYYKDNVISKENVMPAFAFRQTNLRSFIMPSDITSTEREIFSFCTELEEIDLGESIESLGGYAFYQNTSLKKVRLGINTRQLYSGVFSGCTKLEDVILNEGLNYINDNVFADCKKLSSITLPGSVIRIMSKAFDGCDYLNEVVSNIITPFSIEDDVFTYECYQNAKLYVPFGTKETYISKTGWRNFNHIEEMEPSSINNVKTHSNEFFGVYSITGILINNKSSFPRSVPKGIYIKNRKKYLK